jgi:uncharacterized tellurite resistance protein B-like protein
MIGFDSTQGRFTMKSILRFLGLDDQRAVVPDTSSETVRKITDKLNQLPPDEARYIASFSYILGRVAHADLHISAAETKVMEKTVSDHADLTEEQAIIVVQMAKSQNLLFGGTENYLVTREFNKFATRDQKLGLLDCLFSVCAADRSISVMEDNEIRQVSRELGLDHRDFIDIRQRYRDFLAVLKKDD